MKVTCIIVEDEPLALQRTQSYVLKTPSLELLGSFENANEALAFLSSKSVDLIFLDIQMDEISGIEFVESTNFKSKVIFTTAFEEYAVKGFELNVLDYLLKPFSYERFVQAVNKFEGNKEDASKYIFVKSGYALEKINIDEILYIEGMGDYRKIHTTGNKRIMTLQTFAALQELLPELKFHRIHKSYLVSIDKIDVIERNGVVIQEVRIPISATYKGSFHRLIDQLKGE